MNAKRFSLVVVLALVTMVPVYGDPWVLPKGQSFAQFTVTGGTFNSYFNDLSDEFDLGGDVDVLHVQADYSLGLRDNLGLFVSIPFSRWESDFNGVRDVNSGLGDSKLGLKYVILPRELFALSGIAGVTIPGSYDENKINAPGDDSLDFNIGFSLGGVYKVFFYDFDLGYNFRGQEPEDEIRFAVDGGIRPNEMIVLRLKYSKVDQLGGKGVSDPGFRFQELEEDYDRFGINLKILPHPRWHIMADYTWTLAGRNTPAVNLLTGGLGISF